MFMNSHTSRSRLDSISFVANWENDIKDVALEACTAEEDPSGYRVLYYKSSGQENEVRSDDSYRVGGSYLKNRLEKLRRAGYDAPMTKKAINMLDQKKLGRFMF